MNINWDRAYDKAIQLAILLVTATGVWLTWSVSWSSASATGVMPSAFEHYGPLVAMVAIAIVNLLVLRSRPPRPKGPFLRGMLIIGQGAGHKVTQNTLNTEAVIDFKKDYKVAIVCGLNDPTVDKYEDPRISKSDAFTITGQELDVVIQHQSPMTDALDEALAAHARQVSPPISRGFRGYGKRKKVLINYRMNVWTEIVLLPIGASSSSIHKLSDVRHLNGKIITEEVQERRITQTW